MNTTTPTAIANEPTANHGLLQSIANIAGWAGHFQYTPEDSRNLAEDSIAWGREFETLFAERVAAGHWEEDDYMEEVDAFALMKLREVEEQCLKALVWPVHI